MGGSGEGVEGMISWILVVPARAVGMGFAYTLGCLGEFEIHDFLIRLFLFLFFFDFDGGLKLEGSPRAQNTGFVDDLQVSTFFSIGTFSENGHRLK